MSLSVNAAAHASATRMNDFSYRIRALLAAAVVVALLFAVLPLVSDGTRRGSAWLDVTRDSAAETSGSGETTAGTNGADGRTAKVDPAIDRSAGARPEVIVQAVAGRFAEAEALVVESGGEIGSRLDLVNGFEATVPAEALDRVAESGAIRAITANHKVTFENYTYDETTTASNFAKNSGATTAWSKGLHGDGVAVAVIDTGISTMNDLSGRLVFGPDLSGEGTTIDTYGHGTVMAGIIGGSGADSASNSGGAYTGVAPKSTLVSVKAAGRNGATDVSTMLQAMHWVSAYADQYGIRVLNLSWGTPSKQDPSIDPINYAVQRLWRQGIVVIVAAGNSGPNSGTITKPGDDPLVLTVGGFNDNQNSDPADDSVPSWSSRGPAANGLAKPDVVAPGRSLVATRSYGSYVEASYPKALVSPSYIKGSGTSQAAAVTSGLAALLLQARPGLTPDQVKYLLTRTADPIAGVSAGAQGAGRVDLVESLSADPGAPSWQVTTSDGLGPIESSRGGRNVETDCGENGTVDVIKGEIDVRCEPWNGAAWTGAAWTGAAWTGAAWTGAAWTGAAWTGAAWTGAAWTGAAWTGAAWTGAAWTSSWTGAAWTGAAWTGAAWTGAAWTGAAWTTGVYGDDDLFLNAFWAEQPAWWQQISGEISDPRPKTVPTQAR